MHLQAGKMPTLLIKLHTPLPFQCMLQLYSQLRFTTANLTSTYISGWQRQFKRCPRVARVPAHTSYGLVNLNTGSGDFRTCANQKTYLTLTDVNLLCSCRLLPEEQLNKKSRIPPFSQIDGNFLVLGSLEDIPQHDVCNLLHFTLRELSEDNDLIETIQKLGSEVLLQLLIHLHIQNVQQHMIMSFKSCSNMQYAVHM
jgi:hypothetical protein